MGKRQTIRVLCADADRGKLREILDALGSQGVKTVWTDGAARGNDVVLAVLSEAFYADSAAVDALLGLVGAGTDDLLPLQLDDAPIPETIKRVLYSRNIIPTAGRSAAHTAERIISAGEEGHLIPHDDHILDLRQILPGQSEHGRDRDLRLRHGGDGLVPG